MRREPRPSHPKRITTTAQGTWTVCLVLHASALTGRRSRSRPRALERERERSRTDAPARERVQTLASRSCRLQCTRATVHAARTAARRDALSAHRVGTHRRGNGCAELQCTRAVVHAARTAARRDALSAHGLGTRERVQALTAREPAHQECPGECPRSVSVRCETADKARH